ncbi:efflux transporter outer membrane subunit [Methylomarinum vadi]|uniref:efflux transporter outer membrane subunit n=1 Tax=Methylomarinum vadi TaxID=438855 RepID=UPI0004DF6E1C|nr:efflux transporter outer membrane subunit [Methylomarinum vadi]
MHACLRISLICLLLTGCALRPEPSERATMIEAPRLDKTLAASELNRHGHWPERKWWRQFRSPELDDLITTALRNNPDLKSVAARLRQSEAVVDVQAAELYPTVQANVSFSAQRFSANSTQAKLAGEHFRQVLINPLVLRYHLDLWGRDKAALQAAVGEAMASETELADARLLLSVAVAKVYFDLLAAEKKRLSINKIVVCQEQLLHLSQVRLQQGLVATGPVLDAERALNQARQHEMAINAESAVHRHRLAALAGKGPDWGDEIVIAEELSLAAPELPADLPLHLLAHRPDVMATRLWVEAAAEEIKVAETAFYPDVNLVSFAGLHSVSLSDVLLEGSSLAYAVGPSIQFPLFEGGRLRARLYYREAFYDEAVERYNGQVLRAVQEVADALVRWQESEARLNEQRRTINAMSETRRLAEVLYRQGLHDRTQLLQARNAEYREHLRLASLENRHLQAATGLLKALGGGFDTKTPD